MVGYLCMLAYLYANIISDACFSSYGVKIVHLLLNNARFALKLSHFIISHFIYVVCVKISDFNLDRKHKNLTQIQPYAVDHLARESMKSAANCVN